MTATPPVRLITMAWGSHYIDELANFALPALLAPGNLPCLAEQFRCEMVIVTEEAYFDALRKRPVIQAIERYCSVEFRSLDEFITSPDAYGMALTYALFRGFEDLGPAMCDTQLIFFNTDFIMADGCLRSVGRKIAAGERLIFAPSYCVVREKVAPILRARRDAETAMLSISCREMASLAIRNRHNTIRGKTVNQRMFSMEWIDQFYWLVDENTLLGRQLPIAVVSMRPERVLTEMRTFWDYGIVSEACPTAPRCVLGDSDEFLMIELRGSKTARDQIMLGWPTVEEIAGRLQKFTTRDPIELSQYPLVLHSGDLPAGCDEAQEKLSEFVADVIRKMPGEPFDHIDHPIWNYHYKPFHEWRRRYLADKEQGVAR
ncbi:MAG: hypothetical protein ACM30I_05205 [Gemmatimonas sp.]